MQVVLITIATGQKSYNCQEDSDIPVADNLIISQAHIVNCQEEVIILVDLREHHIKYKEIHGVDETIWLENGEHQRLHRRLRKEGKCKIPPDELEKMSEIAQRRTKKYKLYQKKYYETHERTPECKVYQRRYNKTFTQRIEFFTSFGSNICFVETIIYNIQTGSVVYSQGFRGNHNVKLHTITEIEK